MPLPFSEGYERTFFMNTVITYMIRVTKTELKRNKTYGDFLQRHDNEIRIGKLVRVSENLQGQTKEHHKNYNKIFVQNTRSFTCWIKDDKTTMIFSINLNNVEIDESVLNKIIEFYSLTQSWIDKRIYVMSNIGKDNCRQYIERDFENGTLDINYIGVNPYRLSLEEIQRLNKDEFEKKFKKVYQEYKVKYHADKNHVKNSDGKAVRNKARKRSNRLKKNQLEKLKENNLENKESYLENNSRIENNS